MDYIKGFFDLINDLTWGWSLVPMLVVFGLLFTIVTNFAQFTYFKRMFNVLRSPEKSGDPDAITGRQALFVSIGGRVGGGNIAGVAVAISLGGPGAVFWMWVIALIGMVTSIVECSLAQLYKRRAEDGHYRGGPASFIIHGLGQRYYWLAAIYAVCLTVVFSISFNAFQGNTVAGAALDSLSIPRNVTGVFIAIVSGFIVFGGIKRIAKAADFVIPVMAAVYLLMTLFVIVLNIAEVPAMFVNIIKSAFGFNEAIAGGLGAALSHGMRRGLFSNEAGEGSAPNVAATAAVHHPVSQGISQSLSVFIDTIIICSCTAFMILLSDVYVPGNEMDGVVLTQQSLVSSLGSWTQYILTLAILLFSFSSIIYNYYLGENALHFLFTKKAKMPILLLRLCVIAIVFIGAVAPSATSVFFFSDPLMGILVLFNLLGLIMLFPTALRILDDYRNQLDSGVEEPMFDVEKFSDLDIDPKAWDHDEISKKLNNA